ncbi:hypothetical protein ACXWR7_11055, partial [Streptococcus pyogenes]
MSSSLPSPSLLSSPSFLPSPSSPSFFLLFSSSPFSLLPLLFPPLSSFPPPSSFFPSPSLFPSFLPSSSPSFSSPP